MDEDEIMEEAYIVCNAFERAFIWCWTFSCMY